MSKTALVDEIEKQFPSKAAAERAVDDVIAGIKAVVRRGDSVSLREFGTFKKKARAERQARNPRTGETIRVAAKTVLAFDSKVDF